MIHFKVLLLVCGVIAGVYGSDVNVDPEPLKTSVSLPPQPTPIPTNSTPAPTTPTTPTPPPNTTTSSTTPSSTSITPSTATTPTTAKPTTPMPTPTPAPVDPTVANWTVNYVNTSRSCIILFVAAQLDISDGNSTIRANVPVNATASGSCTGNGTQTLIVSWDKNSLELDFEKTNTSRFDLNNIVAIVNISSDGDFKVYNLTHKKAEFSTPLQNSYKCARSQTLNLTVKNSNATAFLRISHLQYQAFLNTTEHKFDAALDCESTTTPDVVPIVVGCVLAALVVAVLAAYLFGRRRCQARGYLSMFQETRTEADYIPMKNLSCFN